MLQRSPLVCLPCGRAALPFCQVSLLLQYTAAALAAAMPLPLSLAATSCLPGVLHPSISLLNSAGISARISSAAGDDLGLFDDDSGLGALLRELEAPTDDKPNPRR
jgi:hypothetical protein